MTFKEILVSIQKSSYLLNTYKYTDLIEDGGYWYAIK